MNHVLYISVAAGLAAAVCYAIQGIAEGLSARRARYYEVAFATQLVALFFVVAMAIVLQRDVRASLSAILIAAVLGLIYAVSLLSYFKALHSGPVSIVSPISGSYSVVAVPIAVLVLGEVLTFWQYIGIVLTVIGVFLVDFKMHNHKLKLVHRQYLKYAFITLILWGIYMPIDSILIDTSSWFTALFWELIFVTIFLFVLLRRQEPLRRFSRSFPPLLKAAIVIGLCEVAGGLVMNYGLDEGSVSIVTPLITTSAVFVVLYSVLFMKQTLHRQQALGVACALIGIMIIGA